MHFWKQRSHHHQQCICCNSSLRRQEHSCLSVAWPQFCDIGRDQSYTQVICRFWPRQGGAWVKRTIQKGEGGGSNESNDAAVSKYLHLASHRRGDDCRGSHATFDERHAMKRRVQRARAAHCCPGSRPNYSCHSVLHEMAAQRRCRSFETCCTCLRGGTTERIGSATCRQHGV